MLGPVLEEAAHVPGSADRDMWRAGGNVAAGVRVDLALQMARLEVDSLAWRPVVLRGISAGGLDDFIAERLEYLDRSLGVERGEGRVQPGTEALDVVNLDRHSSPGLGQFLKRQRLKETPAPYVNFRHVSSTRSRFDPIGCTPVISYSSPDHLSTIRMPSFGSWLGE